MLTHKRLTLSTLLQCFPRPIAVTWVLTLVETALMTLIPLFIGFAIDGLINREMIQLIYLASVLAALIGVSVLRRLYDTRTYGTIKVEVSKALVARSGTLSISALNARLGMGRELVDFLETEVPNLMTSTVQLIVSLIVLFAFHPILAYAALGAAILMIGIYSLFHRRFYALNADHNHQMEKQVGVIEAKTPISFLSFLTRLRKIEVKLSDTEAFVYGLIFAVLLGFILFNLWFAATNIITTTGTIFSIISYSWEFVEAALVLPITLQGWSRLSEIMKRINMSERPMVGSKPLL